MERIVVTGAAALALAGCVRPSRTAEMHQDHRAWAIEQTVHNPRAVAAGEALFVREWRPGDPKAGGDGLGPRYNDVSCVACHSQGGVGGGGPRAKNAQLLVRGGAVSLLHRKGTSPDYEELRLAALSGGFGSTRSERQPRRVQARLLERNTPALFGQGELDRLSQGELLLLADRQQRAGEVSGRVGRTADGDIGRFGWKGDVAGLGEFVSQACANELGLSTYAHDASGTGGDGPRAPVDLDREQVAALRTFVRQLPRPVEQPTPTGAPHPGEALFTEVGCADCHVPDVGDVHRVFSDLLLHDMGPDLSDGQVRVGAYGRSSRMSPAVAGRMAQPSEWRTPPLWGVADSGPWMHDGRARTLERAVQLHDGEGRAAKGRFFFLSDAEQQAVYGFLMTLRAPLAAAPRGRSSASEKRSGMGGTR